MTMPKFLAINYVVHAVQQYRNILEHMLVAVPNVTPKTHNAATSLQLVHFEIPWNYECLESVEFSHTYMQDVATLKRLNSVNVHSIEEYNRNAKLSKEYFSEVVPSSNPESLNSSSSAESQSLPETELENFDHENIAADHLYYLEELLDVPNIRYFLESRPNLEMLMKKFKPKIVKDPFVGKDGNRLDEKIILKTERNLCLQCTIDPVDNFKEVFTKVKLYKEEEEFLEEEFMVAVDVARYSLETSQETPVVQALVALQQNLEKESDQLEIALKLEDAPKIIDIGSSQKLNAALCNKYIVSDEISLIKPVATFPELNQQSTPELKNNANIDRYHLETPDIGMQNHVPDTEDYPWKHEVAIPIAGFSIDLRAEMAHFLPPEIINDFVHCVWSIDKSFDDLSSLCFSTPKTQKPTLESLPTSTLKLKEEKCNTTLELELPWDITQGANLCLVTRLEAFEISREAVKTYIDFQETWEKDIIVDTCPDSFLSVQDCSDINEKQQACNWKINNSNAAVKPVKDETIVKKMTQKKELREQNKVDKSRAVPKINPLDDFIFLRGASHASNSKKVDYSQHTSGSLLSKTSADTRSMSEDTSNVMQERIHRNVPSPTSPAKSETESKKKNKCNVLQVSLSDSYEELAYFIENTAQSYLSLLQMAGLIPKTQLFTALTPDVTRYIFKQHEKLRKDGVEGDLDTYRAVVCLHVLTSTFEYLVQCSLQTAIIHLNSLQEKHSQILEGSLNNFREVLLKAHFKHEKIHIVHPKILQLCHALRNWFMRKQQKSSKHNVKIMIIVKNTSRSLMESLSDFVNEMHNIKSYAFSSDGSLHLDDVLNRLDNHNCVIVSAEQVGDDFPWFQFSLVIEYHATSTSKVLDNCSKQAIRYIGIQMRPWISKKSLYNEASLQENNEIIRLQNTEKIDQQIQETFDEITVVGSQDLTNFTQILQLLETRQNIQVIERDYSAIFHSNNAHGFSYADIIIDERSCIVLESLTSFKMKGTTAVVKRINGLLLQFEVFWIMVLNNSGYQNKNYPLSGDVISNLNSALAKISVFQQSHQVKILYCDAVNAAQLIRKVCELACNNSKTWSREDWLNRSWLTADVSDHEKLLLKLPYLNSFSAQMLLTISPLKKLFVMKMEEISSLCPWLPQKVLKKFVRTFSIAVQKEAGSEQRVVDTINEKLPTQVQISASPELEEIFDYSPKQYEKMKHSYAGDAQAKDQMSQGLNAQSHTSSTNACQERHFQRHTSDTSNINQFEKASLDLQYINHNVCRESSLMDKNEEEKNYQDLYAKHDENINIHHNVDVENVQIMNNPAFQMDWNQPNNANVLESPLLSMHNMEGQCLPIESDNLIAYNRVNHKVGYEQAHHWAASSRKRKAEAIKDLQSDYLDSWENKANAMPRKGTLESKAKMQVDNCNVVAADSQDTVVSQYQTSQEYRCRMPGIAPVTPSIRRTDMSSFSRKVPVEFLPRSSSATFSSPVTVESPPMDYDSDDEYDPTNLMKPTKSARFHEAHNALNDSQQLVNRASLLAETPREKKLTYERVPGAKSGQTRLNFK